MLPEMQFLGGGLQDPSQDVCGTSKGSPGALSTARGLPQELSMSLVPLKNQSNLFHF